MGAIFSPLTGSTQLPAPPPVQIEPTADPAAARRAFLARQRTGRLGTVATSVRGVLTPGERSATRRSLLGE